MTYFEYNEYNYNLSGSLERDPYIYVPPKRNHKLFRREKNKRIKLK